MLGLAATAIAGKTGKPDCVYNGACMAMDAYFQDSGVLVERRVPAENSIRKKKLKRIIEDDP
jgi:hypothetical protein